MPRTKTKREDKAGAKPPASANVRSGEVLTLSEAASYLRFSEADILRLVEEQALPARRLGNEWRFLKAAIQDWLWLSPPPKSNKQAWMELAGVWKDDPYVEEELTEIYRRRGRPTIEDES